MTPEEAFDVLARMWPYPALAAKIVLSVLESFARHIRASDEENPQVVVDAHLQAITVMAEAIGEAYVRVWSWTGVPWFDHRFDVLRGPANWAWLERCTFAMRHVRPGSRVLDLCCGDGFVAGCYYGRVAGHVDGLDNDPRAIELASRLYKRGNVEFYTLDAVRDDFPQQGYNAIFFFAAIEHFSPDEGRTVLQKAARCLDSGGVFFGSTPLGSKDGMHPNHKNEFTDPDDLRRFLEPYFGKIEVSALKWSDSRTELYFTCREPRR